MRNLNWLTSLTLLIIISSTGIFAQKANYTNAHLEFDNLKMDRTYRSVFGKVSKESRVVRYVYNENFGPLIGTAEQMARQYLEQNAIRFGIEDIGSQLKVAHVVSSPGGKHVTFNQYLNNIPVFRSEMVVTINNENMVSFVTSNFRPDLDIQNYNTSVSSSKAISIVKSYLSITGKMLGKAKTELMIFDSKNNGVQLTYRVEMLTEKPMGDWEVFVNAQSGEIIHVKDRMMYQSKATGSGMSFDPDPLAAAGVYYGGDFVDNNDADSDSLNAYRMNVALQGLMFSNGTYKLEGPYCVLDDRESPSDVFPELADSTGFNYTRQQQEFEDINVYYHIDLSYHWLMSMGYDIPGLYQFSSDPHGLSGADNSHYVPSQNYCAWGEGGVDDSEDAAVIWHEYGHAIQDNIPPSMSYSGETMSLQEGSSDYWAASYSRSLYDFGWNQVFLWDAGNTSENDVNGTFWPGRRCNLDWHYPEDYVSGHDGGQIWSSALMKMWPVLGRTVTDNLFIQAHYIWGSSPGLEDAAEAFIQADRDLFGGAHLSTIVEWFDYHGLVDATLFIPQVTHTPLSDTEDIIGPYTVEVEIIPATAPLDTANLFIYWGLNGAFTDSSLLQGTGVINQYSADIPGTGSAASVNYYISVVDTANNLVTDPPNAPITFHSFYVGPDTLAPVIVHTPLRDQAYIRWPANVSANIIDNLGVADATVNYYINNVGTTGSFQMTDQGNGNYLGTFNIDTSSVSVGDSIFYRITATDNSSSSNITNDPMAGFHQFDIIDAKGVVLIIDDDITKTTMVEGKKGTYFREKGTLGISSNNMERWLNNLGYVVEQVTVTTSLTMNWDEYSIVINASGGNEAPVSDAIYRTKWETYVSNPANKYIIEGGEVGYDAASSPGYPTFATNVLHSNDWNGDNAGIMNLVSAYSGHPLVTFPNALPSALSLVYSGYGDQDAQLPSAGATTIYETTTDPGNAGVMIYDDNPNPVSAQMAYYAFNFGVLTDSVTAMHLLENTLEFLLTPESAAVGAITGNVDLTDTANDSGVVVYLNGIKSDTTITDSNGDFAFSGLYNGMYRVTSSHPGYFPYSFTIDSIQVSDNTVGGNNIIFEPIVLGSVAGIVFLSDTVNNIYAFVEVIGQTIGSDSTDISGNYLVENVMPGEIKVIAGKTGYRSVQIDTFMNNDGSMLNIDFTLFPGVNDYVFDFEDGNGSFIESGSWEWGAPTSGPSSAYSGMNVWATSLSANYTSSEHSELITPELNLSGFNEPKLKFMHWYDMEDNSITPGSAYDGGNIKISTDGGSNYSVINPVGGYPFVINAASNALNGQLSFSGTSSGWEVAEFDLTAYEGMNVLLKFDFGSDGSVQYAGWYVDSVAVYSMDTVVTKIGPDDGHNGIPKVFALQQNYPNPFNPITTIRYQLPKTANVKLAVYNMLGQKVKTLVNESQTANYYSIQWNGLNDSGSRVSSGIYLYRIEAGEFIKTNKMLLLK